MIWGIITAVFFLAECALILWNRGRKNLNKRIRKIYCIGGLLTFALAIVHVVTVLKLWQQRPLLMNLSGCVMLLCIAVMCVLFIVNKNKTVVYKLLAVLSIVTLVVHIYSGISSMVRYKAEVQKIDIENVHIPTVPNGIYEGECNVGYIYAYVSVTVSDGEIINIEILEHRNERGKAAESIVDDIILQQKVDVDAVASATNSSEVIKKAVENALKSAVDEEQIK